jgi:hypothetical protein
VKNRIISISLAVMLTLSVGLIGCGGEVVPEYSLTISSTEGGSVTSPGEPGPYTYDEGEVVNLVANAEEGYEFVNWTGDVDDIADVEDATTTITMNSDYSITATFAVKQYSLVIHSTEGGSVTTPGENAYTYDKGEVVNLAAVADEGYQFINWTGDISTIADVNAASTTIAMNGGYSITANFAGAIRDWYDLDAVRDNLDGSYILMNDLDSSTPGYTELASATANGGKGWEPIGSLSADPNYFDVISFANQFVGRFGGQGHEIRDLFIFRPDEDGVGLFGCTSNGVIENLGMVNIEVTGNVYVGGLVGWIGWNEDSVSNSYSTGEIAGRAEVGGLVGGNSGTMNNCHSIGDVTGAGHVGGLAGSNWGTLINSYSTGSVTGDWYVGGLLGWNHVGTVSNSYSTGSVTGNWGIGGLVGQNHDGTVSNSYYSYDEVFINGRNIITIGALSSEDFYQWLANGKFLDVDERLSQENGYYLIYNVDDFKQLLALGQDGSLKFRLQNDLDLGAEPNFYIPYLAGEFDGNGHNIANLNFNCDFISQVGLFGYLASGGTVTRVSAENINIFGQQIIGGLVAENDGTVSNSYSTGRVGGYWAVGGLVGWIGYNGGTVSNSYYDYGEVLINSRHIITIGALSSEDFSQWLDNGRFLDISERLAQEDGYYLINDVSDFKHLLAYSQNDTLKFRLTENLDLGGDANFYIPYLAGEFDGNGHKISNLTLNFDFVAQVGLFGYLHSDGKVSEVSVENVNLAINGAQEVGSLVGGSSGIVTKSYSAGSVTGNCNSCGGLVGWNSGTVSNSYSNSSIISDQFIGGLVGWNYAGSVSNSYSNGRVTGDVAVGGLVGQNGYSVSNSFWDTETSGQTTSAGGTGKTTAEMKNITTFSGAGWGIVALASPSTRNPSYIWNIVDGQTYPFLSWQS